MQKKNKESCSHLIGFLHVVFLFSYDIVRPVRFNLIICLSCLKKRSSLGTVKVTGSQTLTPLSLSSCMSAYPFLTPESHLPLSSPLCAVQLLHLLFLHTH